MKNIQPYPYIDVDSDGTAHLARFPRIRVAQIAMDQLAHGWSVDEMCRQYPALSPAEVHAAMLYYWDHRVEIEREIREEWRQADQEAGAAIPASIALKLRNSAFKPF